ncbi:MAG: XRE family transcriptional regulator [Gammaproteobacteria bacterium]
MTEKLEVVRGSGNVFADVGLANADVEQAKASLVSEIINILDQESLSVREAGRLTGVP